MPDARSTLKILLLDDRPLNALDALDRDLRLIFRLPPTDRRQTNTRTWTINQKVWPNGPDDIFCCSLGSSRAEIISNVSDPKFREQFNLMLIDANWEAGDSFQPGDLDCISWNKAESENYCGNLFSYLSNHLAMTGAVLALFTDYPLTHEKIQKLIGIGFTTLLKKESGPSSLLPLVNVLHQAERARRMRARPGDTMDKLTTRERFSLARDRWPPIPLPNHATMTVVFRHLEQGLGQKQSVRELAKSLLGRNTVRDADIAWARSQLNSMNVGLGQVALKIRWENGTYELVPDDKR